MSEEKKLQLEKLKQHFGRRVHEQARSIVNSWGALQEVHWNEHWYQEFLQSAGKLNKLASRYQFDQLAESSEELVTMLGESDRNRAPTSAVLERLNQCISDIADTCSRSNDDLPLQQISSGRKPVYLCFKNTDMADTISEQLHHFGIPSSHYPTADALQQSILYRLPAAIVVDTEFDGNGIDLISRLQQNMRATIPAIFYSEETPTIEQRLSVVRANGIAFFDHNLDFGRLVEHLMGIYAMRNEQPYRVLVVDDSKSQAFYAEKVLNHAGLFTRTVLEPLKVLEVIDSFQPDAILMDMYMPGCTGPELARVIRQQPRYDAIPILYLSAESDVEKQLDAVSQGGDDFLTKPVPKEVLISTVMNRCRRYRGLHEQVIRDGLTGLVDHNHSLEALNRAIESSEAEGRLVSFAMLDIDRFKSVNDTYGHGMGDRIIHALALFLSQRFRVTDTIGRYGGEEFAIVLPDTDEATACRLLDEVREGFAQVEHRRGDLAIQVTFSCGVAQAKPDDDASSLAQRADEALYLAKKQGRNAVCGSDQSDHS
ncbi:diguanylate cyclase [Reinekea blandensis]|uniref:diguanylate cyclase n=1 Tax=Reinekea blandensis MED297 TaxID=314283 RepID=A4BHC0_9GAMM|nr:diguanylate cyclase [Reinekea blandensis]EAR08468.1 probable two-component response regulator [Reinekea sp. MED297] [Reinekea blandensis MED297]